MGTFLFRQPRIFALVIGVILLLGISSYSSIGRQEDPTITNLFATLVTPFPGADPARVETLVTKKLEDELKEISEIETIKSTSRTGISIVRVELSKFISEQEIEQTWSEIRDAINDARSQMPRQIGSTTFDDDRTGAFSWISGITALEGNQLTAAVELRYAKILQDRLRQVSGTDIVEIFGAPAETIDVLLNDSQLAALKLTIQQVASAVAAADAKVMAGRAQSEDTDLIVEVKGEFDSLQRLKNIPIKTTADGRQIKLGDIANFNRGINNPRNKIAYSNGHQSLLIGAKMESGLRVDQWTRSVEKVVIQFQQELPQDIQHQTVFSQNHYTQERLSEVFGNMLLGIALVIAVLMLSMGMRSAMIVAIVLPLTSLASLSVMQFVGIPIHQMSVTGLIVALGLLVDAAIVMTDDMAKRIAAGNGRLEAAGAAVKRLRIPLLASTVTTALAFTPMALLPGPAGDFVGSIALSVIIMLFCSLLLALTVTPALAGWMLPAQDSHAPNLPGLAVAKRAFSHSIHWSLANPKTSLAVACLLPLTGFISFSQLTAQFFPGVDRDQFYIQVEMNNGSALKQTESAALKVDKILESYEGVLQRHWVVGESAPNFYYNMIRSRDSDIRFAEALITTESPEATNRIIPSLQQALDNAVPEAQILVRGLVQGPPVDAPVELKVLGPDIQVLREIGNEIRARMNMISDITHTRTSLTGGAPKLVFDFDEAKVKQAGYSLTEIAGILNASLSGINAGSLLDGTEEIPVRLKLQAEQRSQSDIFSQLKIPARGADQGGPLQYIPLSSLGNVELKPGKTPITRKQGERINTIQGFIRHGLLPEEVLKQVEASLGAEPVNLPPGYRIETGGDSDARAETTRNLMSSMGLIVALLIATIVLTFNSYRLSAIAGIVCILSAGLSIFSLAVFNYPFGIQALIGVIGSIGVSINAAIIILSSLQANKAAVDGNKQAIHKVVMDSSRHIVSTTITTFGGFLPLLLAGGGFWPPFAMSIAGGVLLSTIVSFYFTPQMFTLWFSRKRDRKPNSLLSRLRLKQA